MIETGKTIEKTEYDADICIVGSGAGGGISAAALTKQGYSVIVVEEGPFMQRSDFNQDARTLVPKMYRRSAGLATTDMSIRILQGRVYGGSTTINWMTSLRTPDHVLDQWVDEFGLENYSPLKMEKHFDAVEKRLNVTKLKREQHSPSNLIIMNGCEKLGIHADESFNNFKDCIGCGTCGLGCPYDAKQDMRLTYLADAIEKGALILTDTRADKIEYNGRDSQRVRCTVLREGRSDLSISISCRRVVVAASAIYSPLLLQASGMNKSKKVGKFLHIHPVTGSFGVYDHDIDPTYGIPQSAVSKEYSNYNGKGYGWWVEAPDLEPFLIGVSGPGYNTERREILSQAKNVGSLIVLVRDGSNHKSNGEVKWKRGFDSHSGSFNMKPVPSIRYRLCKEDEKHLIEGLVNAAEIQFAAGAEKIYTLHTSNYAINTVKDIPRIREMNFGPNYVQKFSAHPMGTVRMTGSADSGVVDENMEMYHYPGIYVMDGSVLPTAIGVNPMISILGSINNALELGNMNL